MYTIKILFQILILKLKICSDRTYAYIWMLYALNIEVLLPIMYICLYISWFFNPRHDDISIKIKTMNFAVY